MGSSSAAQCHGRHPALEVKTGKVLVNTEGMALSLSIDSETVAEMI
jgi:hypothetical protein